MRPPLTERLAGFGTTIFAEMSALAEQTGAINLGQGFPDTDGPSEVLELATQAIRDGVNQYPPGPGILPLRQAIAAHQRRFYGIELDPETEVLVTTGARFMKGLYGWVGFRSIAVPVEIAPRAGGRSKFGAQGLWRLGITGITGFTNWPLRVWTGLGLAVAAVALAYGALLLVRTLVFGGDVPGWSTLAVGIFVLGGVQLISIGVLGEYLARVFTEVKGRPGYIVAEVRKAEVAKEWA